MCLLSQGSFDSLKATFTLKRRTTYFIFQHYIPSAFVVFLSWLSFWIDRHAVPARISLVITCILSTMFLFESINSSLPQISYLKAVDHYLITSFVFIVSCMVEYVCVLNFPDKTSALLRSQSLAPVSVNRFCGIRDRHQIEVGCGISLTRNFRGGVRDEITMASSLIR